MCSLELFKVQSRYLDVLNLVDNYLKCSLEIYNV